MSVFEGYFWPDAAAAVVWSSQHYCTLPSSTLNRPALTPWCQPLWSFETTLLRSCWRIFLTYLSGKCLYYREYKGCIQSDWDFSLESLSYTLFSASVRNLLRKPQKISGYYHLHTWKHSLHHHDLRQQTQFALKFLKKASGGEICSWVLRFAHAVEHPLPKPILLVQNHSGCSIKQKTSALQRRTCDSLAMPGYME